jgi:hypothetical protein
MAGLSESNCPLTLTLEHIPFNDGFPVRARPNRLSSNMMDIGPIRKNISNAPKRRAITNPNVQSHRTSLWVGIIYDTISRTQLNLWREIDQNTDHQLAFCG